MIVYQCTPQAHEERKEILPGKTFMWDIKDEK